VNGGLAPIAGSSVTLFAAGTSGYGAGATSIGTATTNASGAFTMLSYTCPAGNPQTYFTATGGNAGSGANAAIGLMAAVGPCNSLTPAATVTINELTTVATQWPLAQFFDATGHNIGAPSTNATGLQNAYVGFANLASINPATLAVSGGPSIFLPSAGSCPNAVNCDGLDRLNTLANILAGCIESSGASSSACAALMCDATPGLTYTSFCSEVPTITDTLGAAHLIVTNPANNVSVLYGLAGVSTPFSPKLAAAPGAWEIGLSFAPAGASFNGPGSIALDASGNIFAANESSVSELTVASDYRTGLTFSPAGASFIHPDALALDGSNNVFAANGSGNSVSELTAPNYATSGSNFAPAGASFDDPVSLALDGSGNVFVANCGTNCGGSGSGSASELTASGSYATGLNFAPAGAKFAEPSSLALDGSGDIFVTNCGNNCGNLNEESSVSELTAAGSYATGLNFAPSGAGFFDPTSIALDGSRNLFTVNNNGNAPSGAAVSELLASSSYGVGRRLAPAGADFGNPSISLALDGSANIFVVNGFFSELTASSGYATGLSFGPASISGPTTLVALDGSGNVFALDGNGVVELLGLATPVITPIQSCLIYWSSHPGQNCVP